MSGENPRTGHSERARRKTIRGKLRASVWLRDEEGLSLVLLVLLLAALCLSGGASRAGELGQVVVRTIAIAILIVLCVTRRTWSLRSVRLPMAMIVAVAAICLIQLIPLPPALWTVLPGRAPFEEAIQGLQPWRPINLTPDAGLNAALSLSVPLAALAILVGFRQSGRGTVANALLCAMVVAAVVGSFQLSGAAFDNPLINETVGEAAGIFANRNHQALFLACGLPLAARWGVAGAKRSRDSEGRSRRRNEELRPGRLAVALGLAAWLLLLILATGSRAGVALAAAGLAAAAALAWPRLRRAGVSWPRWSAPALLLIAVMSVAAVVALGLSSDRALSLRRLFNSTEGADIRLSSFPLMVSLMASYFPMGSGIGSFDPVFRVVEPVNLLAPTYLNHAHNDVVEVIIEAGLMGIGLVLTTIVAWARLGVAVWRERRLEGGDCSADAEIRLVGWSVLTLILVASLVDYPLRTPTIMVLAVLAAWLAGARGLDGQDRI